MRTCLWVLAICQALRLWREWREWRRDQRAQRELHGLGQAVLRRVPQRLLWE